MAWFARKTHSPAVVVELASAVAMSYQEFLLEKLNGNLPPSLLAHLWAIAGFFTVTVMLKTKKLERDSALEVRKQLGEIFVIKSMGGFGNMDSQAIEDAKQYFDDCWDSCAPYFEYVLSDGAWVGLRKWSKEREAVQELVDDDRVWNYGLIAFLGCTNDAIAQATS